MRYQHGIPADRLSEAAELRAAGWSYLQLGKRYDCSRTTVSNQLKAYGRSARESPA
ncbi:helix-turn-helix domain-containing protein [Nocardioides marmoraquaticus]